MRVPSLACQHCTQALAIQSTADLGIDMAPLAGLTAVAVKGGGLKPE
jgi:hypothetical protein